MNEREISVVVLDLILGFLLGLDWREIERERSVVDVDENQKAKERSGGGEERGFDLDLSFWVVDDDGSGLGGEFTTRKPVNPFKDKPSGFRCECGLEKRSSGSQNQIKRRAGDEAKSRRRSLAEISYSSRRKSSTISSLVDLSLSRRRSLLDRRRRSGLPAYVPLKHHNLRRRIHQQHKINPLIQVHCLSLTKDFIMGRKRMSSRQREGVSKKKKDIQDYQEESNTIENETWQGTGSIDTSEKEKESVKKEELAIVSSEKERESVKKEELDGAGISNGVAVPDAKLDKLSEDMKAMKKELEEKIDAGFKALKDEMDAGFKALREEMAAQNEQRKGSIPKSFRAVARYASVPVQEHTPEIEAILKEVTKSTSSEEDNSVTKTSSSSDDISSSSSEKNKKEAGSSKEVEDVIVLAPRSSPATQKKAPAPTRRSSRIAGK
ncbi:hypothetical protein Dsin_013385 [Dipteronia sinensis]|uniref:Uncharacterized protein n=1 Tax=Dipteronia sinensis TaxID=43782 RepID=A0AAE0EAI5_9ROSI|nr:hypothetical protein Dsin_013385 [Dipteronia sinensis]